MQSVRRSAIGLLPVLALVAVLAACSPAPLYKTGPSVVNATPEQVATAPENFHGSQVVWGGSVIGVHNFSDHSEVEILAYPLDSAQRPRLKEPPNGRFIAIVPGFIEPMNYPQGALVTLRGTLDGSRTGRVGQADYRFALVHSEAMHRWTAEEMRQGHPNISFGVGVGARIR